MNWLTGFDGWSFYTPQAVLIHLKEAAPIWFGRAQDLKSATLTTDLPTTNIVGYSEPLVHHATKHPFDELCDLINYRGWGSCWIGVELDAHYYTARAHQHILNGLPNAKVLDNGALVKAQTQAVAKLKPKSLHLVREAKLLRFWPQSCHFVSPDAGPNLIDGEVHPLARFPIRIVLGCG